MNLLRQLTEAHSGAGGQWLHSANRLLPFVVTPLLVLTIAYELAQLTWSVVPKAPETLAPAAAVPRDAGVPTSASTQLVNSDLFGHTAPHDAPAPPPPEDAPATTLQLKLTGLLYGEHGQPSAAIISEARGHDKTYSVGDEIDGANGVTLSSVYGDRVILLRDGRFETLRPPEDWAGTTAPLALARPDPEEPNESQGLDERDASDRRSDGSIDDEPNDTAAAELVQRVVQATPEFTDDRLVGFRLAPGADRATFESLGLRAGDLVTAINGVAADDPSAELEVTDALANSSGATLTVKRAGAVLTLPINVAHLLDTARPVQ